MKRIVFLLLIIKMSFSLGFCQAKCDSHVDTLSNMSLVDGQGVNYKIFQIIDLQDNHWVDSTRKLVIFYDTNKAVLHLPIPDEEIKNFSIDGITTNDNGITLITSQGGGAWIVRHNFIFVVEHGQLFLYKIISEYGDFDSEKTETKTYHPKLRIDETELILFL
jgi:hypothetical protein